MIAIANYDKTGNLLKYCPNCKEIKPATYYDDRIKSDTSYNRKWRCLNCYRVIDYYQHLMKIPKIRDDY